MKNIFAILALTLISAQVWAGVACFNKENLGSTPLFVNGNTAAISIKFKGLSCGLTRIEYNPNSPKYKGWLRFAPKGKDCDAITAAMFGDDVGAYWLSVSPEVMRGQRGFAQLGYQNIWDPGAGPIVKMNVGCFPQTH